MKQNMDLVGRFHVDHIRDGKIIHNEDFHNSILSEGVNEMFGVMFDGTIPVNVFTSMALIDATTIPHDDAAYSSISTDYSTLNAAEFSNYSGRATVAFITEAATPSGIMASNSDAPSEFTITTGGGSISGIFLCIPSDTVAWCCAPFSDDLTVVVGDIVKVTYTVTWSGA